MTIAIASGVAIGLAVVVAVVCALLGLLLCWAAVSGWLHRRAARRYAANDHVWRALHVWPRLGWRHLRCDQEQSARDKAVRL